MPFVSFDTTRCNLAGVHLAPNGDVVATDGHRMMLAPSAPVHAFEGGVTLPSDGVTAILSAAKLYGSKTRVDSCETKVAGTSSPARSVVFTSGPATVHVRCIDGLFPDYLQVMPNDDAPVSFTVDRKALEKAVTYVATLGADAVQIQVEHGEIHVVSHCEDGTMTRTVAVTTHRFNVQEDKHNAQTGYTKTFDCSTVNIGYLKEALKFFPGDGQIRFGLRSSSEPLMLYVDGATHVLMPMRPRRDTPRLARVAA